MLKMQILSSVAHAMIHKKYINVCIDDKHFENLKAYSKTLRFVSCDKADIVFTAKDSKMDKKCKTNLIFSTSYYLYEHSYMMTGVFFWQKGRPNIIFRKKRLDLLGINLPKNFQKYIE